MSNHSGMAHNHHVTAAVAYTCPLIEGETKINISSTLHEAIKKKNEIINYKNKFSILYSEEEEKKNMIET